MFLKNLNLSDKYLTFKCQRNTLVLRIDFLKEYIHTSRVHCIFHPFLKVRQSRKQIMVSSILPKNERNAELRRP